MGGGAGCRAHTESASVEVHSESIENIVNASRDVRAAAEQVPPFPFPPTHPPTPGPLARPGARAPSAGVAEIGCDLRPR